MTVEYGYLATYRGHPFTAAIQAGVPIAAGQRLVFTVRDEGGAALLTLTSDPGGGVAITDAVNGLGTLTGTVAQANLLPAGQHDADLVLTDAAGVAIGQAPLSRLKVMSHESPFGPD